MILLNGCAHSDQRDAPLATKLPPRPSFMAPVASPVYTRDGYRAIAETKQALTKANKRLVKSGDWYEGIRGEFAK